MRCRFVSMALAIGLHVPAIHGATHPSEYRAKADYLLLFLRYVNWPASAFPVSDSPLVIGVLGGDPFGSLLDSACSGTMKQGRRIRVRRALHAQDAESCHVVFIPRGYSRHHGGWLDTLRYRPILTVVETEREFESGAIIHLAMVEGRLRFDVNLPTLREAGLLIDSPMLVSARRVVMDSGSD